VQLQVTRKGEAIVHANARTAPGEPDRGHDRDKDRLLAEDDPLFRVLGLADADGRLKPTRRAKYRQVEEFLHLLDTAITEAIDKGHLRRPTVEDPLRIVDLGCGNAYLTFAAERFLSSARGVPVRLTGVDVRDQSREHNEKVAGELGVDADFVVGSISGVELDRAPEVVLALHACDTATDEALARAVEWEAPLVLAAPCCHHDIAAQLRRTPTPAPYSMLTRHGILRERFADTLTDGLRATLMRLSGYRVDVVQFVESKHTPRNTLLRATRTGSPVPDGALRQEYDDLAATWTLRPRLAELLGLLEPLDDD
jgi:SAM-dependent methyltransferase